MSFKNTALFENYKRLKDPSGFLKENLVTEDNDKLAEFNKLGDDAIKRMWKAFNNFELIFVKGFSTDINPNRDKLTLLIRQIGELIDEVESITALPYSVNTVGESELFETAEEDAVSAEKYVDDMIKIHGNDYKTVRSAILNNLVNSKYQRVSNDYVEAVWGALRKRFPS